MREDQPEYNPPVLHNLRYGGICIMIGKYGTLLDGKHVGWTQIVREGLYWRIISSCKLNRSAFYRLIVTCDRSSIDLGLFLLEKDCFVLDTRIPVKCMGQGTPMFIIEQRRTATSGSFIPIKPEEPLPCICDLDLARFAVENGQPGIVFDRLAT